MGKYFGTGGILSQGQVLPTNTNCGDTSPLQKSVVIASEVISQPRIRQDLGVAALIRLAAYPTDRVMARLGIIELGAVRFRGDTIQDLEDLGLLLGSGTLNSPQQMQPDWGTRTSSSRKDSDGDFTIGGF